jgi:dienelactone hydrolase
MAQDLAELTGVLVTHLRVVRPDGPGPFPVVVQMHGCGGVQPMQDAYAEAAREVGVAAVIVDSLTPRDISRREAQLTVCTGMRLRGAERAGDLSVVLNWLSAQSWADMGRVGAAGWSHGGWSIMEALAAGPAEGVAIDPHVTGLKLVALVYPYAGPLARTRRYGWGEARPRVVACLAGRDAVVGKIAPRRALERLKADGLEVRILDLPEATHCFDDANASDPRSLYRPDLAEQARGFYAAALAEVLGI